MTTTPLRKTRLIAVITVLLAIVTPCRAQVAHRDSLMIWNGSHNLTVKDFKHPPDSAAIKNNSSTMASSLLDIKWDIPEFLKYDTSFTYEINAVFFRYLSWLYDTSRIRHERLHFDISEVYARKMRRSMHTMKLDFESYNVLKRKMNELYYDHAKYHVLYDKETHSGKLLNMQLRWERNIEIQLDTLKQYSNPKGSARLVRINRD